MKNCLHCGKPVSEHRKFCNQQCMAADYRKRAAKLPKSHWIAFGKLGGSIGGRLGGAAGLIPYEKRIKMFWSKVVKSDGCWNWTGKKTKRGYGKYFCMRKGVTAHRFSWEIHFGKIPDELFVCHHCDNPSCVRPDHLFLGTNLDNINDMMSKGRFTLPTWEGKSRCKNGHLLTPDNISLVKTRNKKPFRRCRQCHRDAWKRWSPKRTKYGIAS